MTRYSVHRFRATVLHLYLRMSVIVAIPLSLLYFLFIPTPDRGLSALVFALLVLWLKWRTRQSNGGVLRFAGGFVLMIMCLILYGVYISNEQLHQEVWMMIFPIVFAPVVGARERVVWSVAGVAGFTAVVLLRPYPLTAASVFVFVSAYLTLNVVTLLLVRHNEQNVERLAHLSIMDPLTKVYNRTYLKDVLMSEVNRCRRNNQLLTVIMLDIDHFKVLNDTYGHLFGDGVLEQVAGVLKLVAQRAGDYVFRYGGEEFCILTSGLSREEVFPFVEKLRLGICALNIDNPGSPHRILTASAGFWCVSDLGETTPGELLLNADIALYRAKEAGRNTVVDFNDIPAPTPESVQSQNIPA